MFKSVPGAATLDKYPYGKVINLAIEEEVEGVMVRKAMQLQPLLKRSSSWSARKEHFEILHADWIENTFPLVCDRGEGLQPVTWEGYGEELATITEWYFLDEEGKKGHLFVQLLNTPARKIQFHMPLAGEFSGPYLYVALVCAGGGKGYGKTLMKLAEAASRALGCTGIALASLSNSAGFYYSQGFTFVSKWDGQKVDVSPWTRQVAGKTFLDPEMDVDPTGGQRMDVDQGQKESKRGHEGEPDDKASERERVLSMYEAAVERARSLYNRLSALSFVTA
jgi:hypothetical protein